MCALRGKFVPPAVSLRKKIRGFYLSQEASKIILHMPQATGEISELALADSQSLSD
jgi:hypothetical protein